LTPRSADLPDFPWDLLEPAKATAAAHADGMVDLSMGTPVARVPPAVRAALAAASDARVPADHRLGGRSGGDQRVGPRGVRAAPGFGVLPTIGSKELVAWLPSLLGLGRGDVVVIPEVCYPTYEVGVRLAGATVLRADQPAAVDADLPVRLIWINSPANPTGRVLPAGQLRAIVAWARERGAVVVSDECYLPLGWDAEPVSVLAGCDGDYRGVLAVHSLSKRSNLAGYRAGFVAGDPALVGELLAVRKHAGMMVPAPVQAAMVMALGDEEHVAEQRARYGRRRAVLRTAIEGAGFRVEHSEAGLYLWGTRDEPCWSTVDWFAAMGILVAPGSFYGPTGGRHVRIALTATDERIDAAVGRLKR
jgi:succinyldiaminopimelate transaminase